jgi:hypothetical protein
LCNQGKSGKIDLNNDAVLGLSNSSGRGNIPECGDYPKRSKSLGDVFEAGLETAEWRVS